MDAKKWELKKKYKEDLSKANGLVIKKRRNWKKEAQLLASNVEAQVNEHSNFEVKNLLKLKKQRLDFERLRCDSTLLKSKEEFPRTPQKVYCSRQNIALKDQCLIKRNTTDLELPDDVNYNNLVIFTEKLKDNLMMEPLTQEMVKKSGTRRLTQITEKLKLINQSLLSPKYRYKATNRRNIERSSIKSTTCKKEDRKTICFSTKYNIPLDKVKVYFSGYRTPKTQLIAEKERCGAKLGLRLNCLKLERNLKLQESEITEKRVELKKISGTAVSHVPSKKQFHQPTQANGKQTQNKGILVPFNIFNGKPKTYHEAYKRLFKPMRKQYIKVDDSLFLAPNFQCNYNKREFTFALNDIKFISFE